MVKLLPMLCLKIAGLVANCVDPGEMLHSVASHLGLHCLLRPGCPNTYPEYGMPFWTFLMLFPICDHLCSLCYFLNLNPCHAKEIKMPHPLLNVSQSDYLIKVIDINSHTKWKTVQIQISWLLQKPTDLDLHCLQRQGISGFSRRVQQDKG